MGISKVILGILILSASLTAATLNVPEDYPTIQLAISASETGDIVLVAPGIYTERLDFLGKNVRVHSSGGSQTTFLRSPNGDSFGQSIVDFSSSALTSSELKGFTFDRGNSDHLIRIYGNSAPVIRENVFRGLTASNTVILCEGGSPTIAQNVFAFNTVGNACVGIGSGNATILNNTFDRNSRGFYSLASTTVARNNIVSNSTQYGVFGSYAFLSYNNVYANDPDFQNASGTNNISADPQFISLGGFDYYLGPGSPCIDAGDPSSEYNDPDGSRSDIGAVFFVGQNPAVGGLQVVGSSLHHVVDHTPTFRWTYFDTTGAAQVRYQIEVGEDNDWDVAELWSTGEVHSSSVSAEYSGAELIDGNHYHIRIRVGTATDWSTWNGFFFTMNSQPTVPVGQSPAFEDTAASGFKLIVANSVDEELDAITYDYQIYSDAGLTQLIYSATRLYEGNQTSSTPSIITLPTNANYWWRSRSNDGYEYSNWSAPILFYLRNPWSIRVPSDRPTIQSAIDIASVNDTVLVAPGYYPGYIRFGTKSVKLVSEAGPLVTYLQGPTLGTTPEQALITFVGNALAPSELSGFTITSNNSDHNCLIGESTSPVIRNNIFTGLVAGTANVRISGSDVVIVKNIFDNNKNVWASVGVDYGKTTILDNTFYRNDGGFYSNSQQTIAINNIVTQSNRYGIWGQYALLDYNCVGNNAPDFQGVGSIGTNNLLTDPMIVDPANRNFSLHPNSPCIDAGHPDAQYQDPDGTRGDIGAVDTRLSWPLAGEINIGSEDIMWVLDHSPVISWDYMNEPMDQQAGYQIEVGIDDDWSNAELWSSGEVMSNDNHADYLGAELLDGESYIGRIRLFDGTNWGDWLRFSFRMNSVPTQPTTIRPIDLAETPANLTRLLLRNSTDAEQDSLSFDFEVYDDYSLTQLITRQELVPAQKDSTFSEILTNLEALSYYWWRVRAFDGREYSSWSVPISFFTRKPVARHVPLDYSSIPTAIVAAEDGDSVIVAPGTYSGNIQLNGKHIFITSLQGSKNTILLNANINLNSTAGLPSELSGFTVRGASRISVPGGVEAVIQNNHFVDIPIQTTYAIETRGAGTIIRYNLFSNCNPRAACIAIMGGPTQISNNTLVDCSTGIGSLSNTTVLQNNIVIDIRSAGIHGDYAQVDYNIVHNCSPNTSVNSPLGTHNLFVDPMFILPDSSSFELYPESPGVDAGNPSPEFNDPDGSRNDIGAFPVADIALRAFDLILPDNTPSIALDNRTPTFAWDSTDDGYQYSQTSYSLYLSVDSLFEFVNINGNLAESNFTPSNPLAWGTRYWWKVRAQHQFNRERWSEQVFSFRTMTLGDANGNARVDVSDIVFIVNFIFAHGATPVPLIAGDVNCDAKINIGDAVYLVNYVFISGPPPCDGFTTMAPTIHFGPEDNAKNLQLDSEPDSH